MASTFGEYLKHLRKRAGMTQQDLAAATGYSRSLVAAQEQNTRLPDPAFVLETYVPALGLQEEPRLAAQLVELAAQARGERLPTSLTMPSEPRLATTAHAAAGAHQLPAPPAQLIGRDREITRLSQRFLGHHGRLLTLVGPPGVGKTRLALALGAALQRIYQDGACFVPLAALTDPALVAVTVLAALNVQDGSPKPPEVRLVEYLRRKEMLLILDNFEQIIAAAPLLAELLAECATLRILVTSRERLHLRAEQRYRVPPLDLAAAVELFSRRAAAIEAGFVLTPENYPLVEAICQRLDRLPLAIELCAAQVDLLSLPQLLAGLQTRRLDLLAEGASDLPPQQRTLRRAIHHSYQLLNDAERGLLRSLGVFAGGFALSELASMYAAVPATPDHAALTATLHALIGKSLVQVETLPSGEPRYLLLETIREFALEQMRAESEEAGLRARHFAAYLHLFRTGDGCLRGPEAAAWLARLEPEQDNVRAAMQWALVTAHYEEASRLFTVVGWFWHMRGQLQESGRWLVQLVPHRHQLSVDRQLLTLIDARVLAWSVEDFQPADRWRHEIMQLLEISTNQHLHTAAWYFEGVFAPEFEEATAAWDRSLAAARLARAMPPLDPEFGVVADCDFLLGNTLWAYATTSVEQGDIERALPMLMESRELFRRRESRYEMADSSGTLGLAAFLQGDLKQAQHHLQEAVALADSFHYQEMVNIWRPLLALVILYTGDAPEARRVLDACLRLSLELGDKRLLARVCIYFAELALWEGDIDAAEEWLARSLTNYSEPNKDLIYEVIRAFVAARLAAARAHYPRAATLFGFAEQLRRRTRYALAPPIRTQVDAALATVQAALGAARFATHFAAGEQLTLAQVFALEAAPDRL